MMVGPSSKTCNVLSAHSSSMPVLLAADDDDLPMSQLRTRMLAEPLRPPPPSRSQLFGEQMITILRDGLRQQLIEGASGKLGQHRAPRTGLAQNGERVVRSLVYTTTG